ncbi:alpha/beta-hydrolase [Rhizodiscina lignyota]|uniref:Alpha/beta-hydrolase n=1 Tax=Rhizodiscina lignyota TaxID=1504668 RepID=A0A9P4IAV0_9PEZI|nr:alpha/beta-hydrolase [Rhizodiscina lignyota]
MRAPVLRSIGAAPKFQRCLYHRSFSTCRPLKKEELALAYDLHEPPAGVTPGPAILFLHGLFGSKKNNRSISKVLARELSRPVYALDLRNHGDSPHALVHDYAHLASDVEAFITQHSLLSKAPSPPTIIGHSMGAKTALTLALRSPDLVANVVAVDNAPVDAALKSDFGGYVQGMKRVEEAGVKRQSEADDILKDYAPELPVRQFLLTNLIKPRDSPIYKWRIPLRTLAMSLDNLGDFPFKSPEEVRFEKPALFIRGTRSHYIPDEVIPIIGRFFPRFEIADVEAGHWVISENPEGFRKVTVEFLQDKE